MRKILKQDSASPINKNHGWNSIFSQIIKFSLIGVLNTTVDLLILNIMATIFTITAGTGFAIIKSCSFIGAVVCSYFANKYWTFDDKSKRDRVKKFSQFLLVSLIGMLINVSVATIVVTSFKLPINNILQLAVLTDRVWINLGALTGTAVGLIWNFVGYKFFVFRKKLYHTNTQFDKSQTARNIKFF